MKRVTRSELKKLVSYQVPSFWSETAFHIHTQGCVQQRTSWRQSLRLVRSTALLPPSSPTTQQRLLGHGFLNIEDSRSHTTPQSVGLLWTSDRPDTEISDNTRHSQETNILAHVGIRTHNLSRRAAADPRLRPRGHRTGRST
jgi:hypothetical protein